MTPPTCFLEELRVDFPADEYRSPRGQFGVVLRYYRWLALAKACYCQHLLLFVLAADPCDKRFEPDFSTRARGISISICRCCLPRLSPQAAQYSNRLHCYIDACLADLSYNPSIYATIKALASETANGTGPEYRVRLPQKSLTEPDVVARTKPSHFRSPISFSGFGVSISRRASSCLPSSARQRSHDRQEKLREGGDIPILLYIPCTGSCLLLACWSRFHGKDCSPCRFANS